MKRLLIGALWTIWAALFVLLLLLLFVPAVSAAPSPAQPNFLAAPAVPR